MSPEITKIIENYLQGNLSISDKQAFEKRLETSLELQEELQIQRDIHEVADRGGLRDRVTKTAKNYHFLKVVKLVVIGAIVSTLMGTVYYVTTKKNAEFDREFFEELDKKVEFVNSTIQYLSIAENGEAVLSADGVLLSVPKHAFLLNGKPHDGEVLIQLQEALDSKSIVKAGLSTMSGNQALETQGMISLKGYTNDGKELTLNPAIGVYVQVPVDELKEGMQLFAGVKDKSGNIDWQNPEPLAKIPICFPMNDLSFYPEGYSAHLDAIKWAKTKAKRDSLYLSFEGIECEEISLSHLHDAVLPIRKMTTSESRIVYGDNRPVDRAMSYKEAMKLLKSKNPPIDLEQLFGWKASDSSGQEYNEMNTACPTGGLYVLPSKVLGFWNEKFNNTILATKEFEQRMQAIHKTCKTPVLEKYLSQLSKPLSQIDAEIVAMGYPEFQKFVTEGVGKIELDNVHMANLKAFYEKYQEKLSKSAVDNNKAENEKRKNWDTKIASERDKQSNQNFSREALALKEEFNFNMRNVTKQINRSVVGFKLIDPKRTVVNIDRIIFEATVTRTSVSVIDPANGKEINVKYNSFSFTVPKHTKYKMLFAYVFPHDFNSFQRIDHISGNFNYPLNGDVLYDFCVVGMTDSGFEYFEKQTIKSGDFGEIKLKKITEQKMDACIEQLNRTRAKKVKPLEISSEIRWLKMENVNNKEQKKRHEEGVFKAQIGKILFPCYYMCELR